MSLFRLGLCGAVIGCSLAGAGAQDTRKVTEPQIPSSCTKMKAQLRSVSNDIAEADEGKLDTERIQKALDHCKAGRAVELVGSRGRDAFLTGPLEMRTGVTLLVDKGVTLYGSRDAAMYEVKGEGATTGVCGTIAGGDSCDVSGSAEARACKGRLSSADRHQQCARCWDYG